MDDSPENRENIIIKIIKLIGFCGMSLVILIMFLSSGDVILRLLFNHSIVGAHEIIEFMVTTLTFMALAYTAIEKKHVAIDILTGKLPDKVRSILSKVTSLLSLFIWVLIAWQTFAYGLNIAKSGVISPTINISVYPFIFITSFGSALLCIVLLMDIFNFTGKRASK